MSKSKTLSCPKCRANSSEGLISYAYLEWRVHEVVGVEDDSIHSDTTELGRGEEGKVTGLSNENRNCTHFYCSCCDFKWEKNNELSWV